MRLRRQVKGGYTLRLCAPCGLVMEFLAGQRGDRLTESPNWANEMPWPELCNRCHRRRLTGEYGFNDGLTVRSHMKRTLADPEQREALKAMDDHEPSPRWARYYRKAAQRMGKAVPPIEDVHEGNGPLGSYMLPDTSAWTPEERRRFRRIVGKYARGYYR